jgi:chromosomal replication initiator protein
MENPMAEQLILEFPARPEHTFASFIVSEGSRFAFETAKSFASDIPGLKYSSLFIYATKNLGKSHLLHSIGNQTAKLTPAKKALYIHTSDFIKRMQSGDANETVKKIDEVDVLLLDDVHYLEGQPAAQEKLYSIYNDFRDKKKKLVFAADRPPDQLINIEDYLISRFQWGMMAEVKAMDPASTARLFVKLAQDSGLAIPENVVDYLLLRIPRDFISVKQCVETLNRASYQHKRKVSIPLAKSTLNLD